MFVEYSTFALEKLKRHRLAADVRHFSSARMLRTLSLARCSQKRTNILYNLIKTDL